jgi:hypothetical protein
MKVGACSKHGRDENAHKILGEKSEGKTPLYSPKIKTCHIETGCEVVMRMFVWLTMCSWDTAKEIRAP